MLISSQSTLATSTLDDHCRNDNKGNITREVRISSYIENWTQQKLQTYIKDDKGQVYVITSGVDVPNYSTDEKQKHQAAMIQDLAQVAYFTKQKVNICFTSFPYEETV